MGRIVLWAVGLMALLSVGQTRPADSGEKTRVAAAWLAHGRPGFSRMDPILAEGSLDVLARLEAETGDISAARETLHGAAPELAITAACAIAIVQAQHGDPGAADTLNAAEAQARAAARSLLPVAIAAARLGQLARAERLAAGLADPRDQAHVRSWIGLLRGRAGNAAAAREAFQSAIKDTPPDSSGPWMKWNVAIFQGKAGDDAAMHETLKLLKQPRMRAVVLVAIAQERRESGDQSAAQLAIEAWHEADSEKQPPFGEPWWTVADTIGQAARVLLDTGHPEDARAALADARRWMLAKPLVTPEELGAAVGLAGILRHASDPAAAELESQALALAAKVPESERASAYLEVAAAQAGAGESAAALESLARSRAFPIEPVDEATAAGALAAAFVDAQGVKADLSWIEQLRTPDAKTYAWLSAAAALLPDHE